MKTTAPFGTWTSPITADAIVTGAIGFGQVAADGGCLYWIESRPAEAGRNVLVRRDEDGLIEDVTPAPWNVRTRVHEYGGGAFLVCDGTVLFSHFPDQRLYRLDPGAKPRPLTPETALRFADGDVDRKRGRAVFVREDHRGEGEAKNTLVWVDLEAGGEGTVFAEGHDFFSTPRLSPDASKLCWLAWDHPRMPWDGTELYVADLGADGGVENINLVAGGPEESIHQPTWSPDGGLYFSSDRSGWWNLYRLEGEAARPLCPREAEFGRPQWQLGGSLWAFTGPQEILACYGSKEGDRLGRVDTESGRLETVDLPYTVLGQVVVDAGRALLSAGSATMPTALVTLDLASGEPTPIRASTTLAIDAADLSVAQAIEFPTTDGLSAHAWYYRPQNASFQAPPLECPPLLVFSHGGPTGHSDAALRLPIQFWTSRGFAVLDVNYGGSSGYGRAYRERLSGRWGIVDVDDCVNAARFLVERGDVDGDRLAIRGGSAGGYTTLAALAFRSVFRAGASLYGVSDLSALAEDTHKFESRYLDGLVGPYPEQQALYEARSPIHHVEGLDCPVIFLQGLEDRVVPPSQAEIMVDALRRKGIPVAYVPFEGEQHGFRQAKNIKRAMEAELFFYGRIFGFEPADEIEPLKIDNLPS